ncbi:MAG: hypothetical protein RLP02_07715 [Coleofasciculus sp. C2-GNP5-27]
MPGISQAQALTVIDQKLHRGLIPRQNYLWVGLSRFLEAVTPTQEVCDRVDDKQVSGQKFSATLSR